MKSWYENLYEIRNVTLIFQKRKKKTMGYLIIYGTIFFYEFLNNFSSLLLCEIYVLDILVFEDGRPLHCGMRGAGPYA